MPAAAVLAVLGGTCIALSGRTRCFSGPCSAFEQGREIARGMTLFVLGLCAIGAAVLLTVFAVVVVVRLFL